MRINGNEFPSESPTSLLQQIGITRTAQRAVDAAAVSGSEPFAADSTAISQNASLFTKIMSLPDMNMQRVSEVQQAIADGSLRIDSGRTANALMQTMLK